MTLSIADRLFETTTTTGTGPFTLAGAVAGFQGFSVLGTGKKTTYYIDDGDAVTGLVQNWMDVIGTVTVSGGTTTLSVDTVLASSNNGSPVNFGSGTKNVRGGIGAKVLPITDENLNNVRHYGTDAGSANAHAVTLPYAPLAYSDGMEITYRATAANTTAGVTVNVNGLGAKAIKVNGSDPGIGAFAAGTLLTLVYRSSNNTFEVANARFFLPLSGGSLVGPINEAKAADIASAATTDIGAATGNYVTITGTTTITALGTAPAGAQRTVRFAGVLTLTHNATSLILPGGANIITAAGDMADFVSEGSGNWRCVDYQKANGQPVVAPATGPFSTYFESAQQTWTTSSTVTIPHGLGVVPKMFWVEGISSTIQGNVQVNQRFRVDGNGTTNPGNVFVRADATNIYADISANGIYYNGTSMSTANTRLIGKALV